MDKAKRYLFGLAMGLALLGIGFGLGTSTNKTEDDPATQRDKYPLLAKRLFIEDKNDVLINFVPLRSKLERKLESLDEQDSFYFEYLPTGTSIRINSVNEIAAASLVKLPIVMNMYHAKERGLVNLDEKRNIEVEDLDNSFGTLFEKGAGIPLSLEEAAKFALTESDNTAANFILRNTKGLLSADQDALRALDIDQNSEAGQPVISSQGYASILKCLYFSCYLENDNSEHVLEYLTQSTFKDGLSKNIPKEVKVAHKMGVYGPNDVHSDCGIFYVPKRPYILCMMLSGDQDANNELIASTSKDIYDWVIAQEAKE